MFASLFFEQGLSATYYDTQDTKKMDFVEHEEEIKHVNPWTDVEKCIFLDRFLQHPKDFRKIASFLKNKTTRDCVAFYYDSKQSIPYKRALREHLQRKKRKIDPKWDATIQSALCVGAVVTAGSGPDKPLKFSLPPNDYTFHTKLFHPMQRDIFDRITGEEDECDVQENSKKRWVLFSLDKSARKYLKQKDLSPEKMSGSVSGDDDGNGTSAASSRSEGGEKKKKGTAPSVDKGGVDLKSPGGAKKVPQKWTTEEKQIFFDTVERHGKLSLHAFVDLDMFRSYPHFLINLSIFHLAFHCREKLVCASERSPFQVTFPNQELLLRSQEATGEAEGRATGGRQRHIYNGRGRCTSCQP